MPPITIDGSRQATFFALFSGLKYLGMERVIYYFKNRFLNFSPPVLCEEVMKIINSQKCLERLKFNTIWQSCDDTVAQKVPDVDNTSKVGQLRKDKNVQSLASKDGDFSERNLTYMDNTKTDPTWSVVTMKNVRRKTMRNRQTNFEPLAQSSRVMEETQSLEEEVAYSSLQLHSPSHKTIEEIKGVIKNVNDPEAIIQKIRRIVNNPLLAPPPAPPLPAPPLPSRPLPAPPPTQFPAIVDKGEPRPTSNHKRCPICDDWVRRGPVLKKHLEDHAKNKTEIIDKRHKCFLQCLKGSDHESSPDHIVKLRYVDEDFEKKRCPLVCHVQKDAVSTFRDHIHKTHNRPEISIKGKTERGCGKKRRKPVPDSAQETKKTRTNPPARRSQTT